MKAKKGETYWTDNGACLCYEHLGMNARMTGRDISGQTIARVTQEDRDEADRLYPDLRGRIGRCEVCACARGC